jgi:hypothetical protein
MCIKTKNILSKEKENMNDYNNKASWGLKLFKRGEKFFVLCLSSSYN